MTLRAQPWWTPDAVRLVQTILTPDASVLEFGSGGSTPWLGKRAKRVIAIEHHPVWAKRVRLAAPKNVELRLLPRPYHTVTNDFHDGAFDLVIVDGRDRVKCFLAAMRLVKPGGWLMLDDARRAKYQPAWDAVQNWQKTVTTNSDPKEQRTGSRSTWLWQKPTLFA